MLSLRLGSRDKKRTGGRGERKNDERDKGTNPVKWNDDGGRRSHAEKRKKKKGSPREYKQGGVQSYGPIFKELAEEPPGGKWNRW